MKRGLGITLAVALAALSVTAGPASALKGYEAAITDQGGGFDKGRVKCGPGERVVSGGFSGVQSDSAVVNKAVRGKAWLVRGDFALPATVYAYCDSQLDVSVAKKTKKFPDSDRLNVAARCAGNQVPAAGGWAYRELVSNSPVYTSAPYGDHRWLVGGFTSGIGDKLTAYAYCLNGDVRVDGSLVLMPDGENATNFAGCDQGEELLGGGFQTDPKPDFGNTFGPDPFFYATWKSNQREWSTSAHNYSSIGGTLSTFATCLD